MADEIVPPASPTNEQVAAWQAQLLTMQNSLDAQAKELADLKAKPAPDLSEIADLKAEMEQQARELQKTRDRLAKEVSRRRRPPKKDEVVPPVQKPAPKGKTASGVDWI